MLTDNQAPIQKTRMPEQEVRKQLIPNISDLYPGCKAASQMFHGCAAHSGTDYSLTTTRSYSDFKYGVKISGQTSITDNAPVGIG